MIALAWLGSGCRFGFDARSADATDGPIVPGDSSDGPSPDAQLGAFGPATKISVSTNKLEDDPTLTADLLELVFESDRVGGKGMSDLWITRRSAIGMAWSTPIPILELNSTNNEEHPSLAGDGLSLWYASDRPGGLGSYDIYVATRADRNSGTLWSNPQLATALNGGGNDEAPQIDPTERVMVMAAGPNNQENLFVSTRATTADAWPAPSPIAELNAGPTSETGPMLSSNLLTIYFSTNRNGSSDELYFATRTTPTGTFGTAVPIGELDAGSNQTDPWISPDQRTIVFVSEQDGSRDLFEATR